MNDTDFDEQEDIICVCAGTTKAKVKELIARGIDDMDKIASATGANTGCGGCEYTLSEFIDDYISSTQNIDS